MKRLHITQSFTNANQDSLKRYLNEIASYRLLTAEEEAALAKKIKAGERTALQQLIKCNLRFVVSVAKKYEGRGILLADLISSGNIGLVKAAERFDGTRGIKFISYAVWWIRQSIMQTIAEQGQLIRLPVNQIADMLEVRKAQNYLEKKLERMPTIIEIAAHTGITLENIKNHLSDSHRSIPLETEDHEDKPGILNFLKDKMFNPPDTEIQYKYLQKAIALVVNSLSENELYVLNNHYGLNGNSPMLLEDIAVHLNLSVTTIRKIKYVALHRLSRNQTLQHLKEHLSPDA